MYLVLIPHCMREILAKECKSGKFTVLALDTVAVKEILFTYSINQNDVACTYTT